MSEAHVFGRYRVTGSIGAGGMGEVFAAVDEVLGREVAVKTLRGKHDGLAARLLDERFRQEARAIAALAHPGVVQVFDIDLAAEPPYIVMERVSGPSLKERLAAGPLDVVELRALGIQIARALAAAHAAGILHRDVKPANILCAAGGSWKLADFGVAHVPDSAITMTGQFVGSPAYAPPEALVRGQSMPAGDVYGLGAALYEAALGKWPRAEATTGALLAPVPALGTLVPALPPELAAAIDRALVLEPEARPSPSELADLIAGASSTPGHATTPGQPTMPGMASSGTVAGNAPAPRLDTPLPFAIPARAKNWKPWAIGIGALLLIGIVAALARNCAGSAAPGASPTPTPAPTPTKDVVAPEPPKPDQPAEIHANTPPIATRDRRADKDWRKVVDKLYRGEFGEARKKLDEFDRRWGESEETKQLREQIKDLGDDPRRDHEKD